MIMSMSSTISFSLAEKIKKELGNMYESNNMSMRVNVRKVGAAKTQSEVITSKEILSFDAPISTIKCPLPYPNAPATATGDSNTMTSLAPALRSAFSSKRRIKSYRHC